MRKVKVTYTVVAYINLYGFDDDSAELERAKDMVCDEPGAYIGADGATVDAEFVEADG